MTSTGGTDGTTQDKPSVDSLSRNAGMEIGFRDQVPESVLKVVKTESVRFPETSPLDSGETPHSSDRTAKA